MSYNDENNQQECSGCGNWMCLCISHNHDDDPRCTCIHNCDDSDSDEFPVHVKSVAKSDHCEGCGRYTDICFCTNHEHGPGVWDCYCLPTDDDDDDNDDNDGNNYDYRDGGDFSDTEENPPIAVAPIKAVPEVKQEEKNIAEVKQEEKNIAEVEQEEDFIIPHTKEAIPLVKEALRQFEQVDPASIFANNLPNPITCKSEPGLVAFYLKDVRTVRAIVIFNGNEKHYPGKRAVFGITTPKYYTTFGELKIAIQSVIDELLST
jgi:hypothetical protein